MLLAIQTNLVPCRGNYTRVPILGVEIIEGYVGSSVLQTVLFDIIVPKLVLTIPITKYLMILIILMQKHLCR